MSEKRHCPQCGTEMSNEADLKDLCPRCLLVLGLGGQPGERRIIGNYEILRELGRGGMGVVYKAYQASLNRVVALKVLSENLSKDKAFVKRFRNEAMAAARLNHPNVVTIYDVESDGDVHFIAMEYVKGRALSEVIAEEGQLDAKPALEIVRQVADALGAAHDLGVVHRDVKPQNIMVNEAGRVKVLDFGLAKLVARDASVVTQTGTVLGTLAYMAPEQCRGDEIDCRADLYALGIVLYQMLAGRVPFKGDTPAAIIHCILNEPLPPVRDFNRDVPEGVLHVLQRATAKAPEDRYSSAADMDADLQRLLADEGEGGTRARVAGVSGQKKPPRNAWGRVILVVAALAVLIALVVYVVSRFGRNGDQPAPPPGPPPVVAPSAREVKLVAGDPNVYDVFGGGVAIDGDTAVVGALRDDDLGGDSGSAYVFERAGDEWPEVAHLRAGDGAENDWFGRSPAIDGDTILVSAHWKSKEGIGKGVGAVYIFERRAGAWREAAKLTASDPAAEQFFGYTDAIDGDTIAVGAHGDSEAGRDAGAIYVFQRDGSRWVQRAKLRVSDPAERDEVGQTVDVSGRRIVTGIARRNILGPRTGAVYVFCDTSANGDWTTFTETRLVGRDTAPEDQFGGRAAIDGNTLVGVASRDGENGFESGSACVFQYAGTHWVERAKLVPSNGAAGDRFGANVAVSGRTAVIGAQFHDARGTDSGAAYVFRDTSAAGDWSTHTETVLTASDAAAGDRFGWTVGISGDTAIVGAPLDDDTAQDSGSAYIYTFRTQTPAAALPAPRPRAKVSLPIGDRFPPAGPEMKWDESSFAVASDPTTPDGDGSVYEVSGVGKGVSTLSASHFEGRYPLVFSAFVRIAGPIPPGQVSSTRIGLRVDDARSPVYFVDCHAHAPAVFNVFNQETVSAPLQLYLDAGELTIENGDWVDVRLTVTTSTLKIGVKKWLGSDWSREVVSAEKHDATIPRDRPWRIYLAAVQSDRASAIHRIDNIRVVGGGQKTGAQ